MSYDVGVGGVGGFVSPRFRKRESDADVRFVFAPPGGDDLGERRQFDRRDHLGGDEARRQGRHDHGQGQSSLARDGGSGGSDRHGGQFVILSAICRVYTALLSLAVATVVGLKYPGSKVTARLMHKSAVSTRLLFYTLFF